MPRLEDRFFTRFAKLPGEDYKLTIDFSDALKTGETISSAAIGQQVKKKTGETATLFSISTNTSSSVTVKCGIGGDPGSEYVADVIATTSVSEKIGHRLEMIIPTTT